MPELAPFGPLVGAIVGACIAGFIALIVMRSTQRHQLLQDAQKDARAQRATKRERLRTTYEPVIHTAEAMTRASVRLSMGGRQGTADLQDEMRTIFDPATEGLWRARSRLLLDPEARPVYDAFEIVQAEYSYFQDLSNERLAGAALRVSGQELDERRRRLGDAFAVLLHAARASLTPLEEPVQTPATMPRRAPRWMPWRRATS
jgi:hypothetical protein